MIGLIQAQFAENTNKQWMLVFVFLFLNSIIAITQISWEYYVERYSFWDIVLHITNNPIDIMYTFTLITVLTCVSPFNRDSWSQNICVRSDTRLKYYFAILITQGFQTALFVIMIPLSCYFLCAIYPITFQNDWGLITAAGHVLSYLPQDLVLLSVTLLFFRFYWLGLFARIITIITGKRVFGVILYLLLSFGLDAGYENLSFLPSEFRMLNNTLVSVNKSGEWQGINVGYSLIYWVTMNTVIVVIGYLFVKQIDLSGKEVK